jgi:hypothetical protein
VEDWSCQCGSLGAIEVISDFAKVLPSGNGEGVSDTAGTCVDERLIYVKPRIASRLLIWKIAPSLLVVFPNIENHG